MAKRPSCPRCDSTKYWVIRREKRRCAGCHYEWKPGALPLRLTSRQWRQLLGWFAGGLSALAIVGETGLERKRVLRAHTVVRIAMMREVPHVFRGTVELDETYLGGAWKNKRKSVRSGGTKRGRGTSKTPVFGILCRGGTGWAQVVTGVGAETLMPLICRRVKPGSMICSDTWKSYNGIAAKGYVHRLVEHG